jgi:23S rRNA-/tRNA-specific pseudouridylate synthase
MTKVFTAEELARKLPLAPGVRVAVVGAEGLVALEKPAGVLTHPNHGGASGTALLKAPYNHGSECYHWTPEAGEPGKLFLLNRLDSPTSGLVLAALTEEAAEAGRGAFAAGQAQKTYFALVIGRPRPPQGRWTDRLARGAKEGRGVRVKAGAGGAGVTAVTRYEWVETRTGKTLELTLLKLEPVTGRTHQLRVQCAWHHHPILGDATYGNFARNREFARRTGEKRLFLHAAAVRLPELNFAAESALPEAFRAALAAT